MIGGLVLAAVAVGLFTYAMVKYCENRALEKTSWRIFRDDMRVIHEDEVKSMLSIGTTRTKLSSTTAFVKHHAIVGTNTHASFHAYPQRRPIAFCREDTVLLTQMKQVIHDNLNPFLGMAFNEKEEMLILWKFCSRGSVQDIIYNEDVALDNKFHAAFIRDITLGLEYLHASSIGYHGALTTWSCLIDRNWTVKLTDYGVANQLERWEKLGMIQTETLKDNDDKSATAQLTSVLYKPPEFLKNLQTNMLKGTEKAWTKQTQARRQAGDIYSFGMVMYEILFRSLPFRDNTNLHKLVDTIRDGIKLGRPSIQDRSKIHPDLVALLQDCWHDNPEARPSIRRVRLNTESYLKVKGSLVDQMMRVMESYANNLEKLVKERTVMLEDANIRADKLLSQLLPTYVANELKLGRAVPPKTFQMASVMFSDIVGFTKLCASSSPLEVVTMLNALYTGFDDIINKHDAYKVETIGDAYMVVSGIPEENGLRHLLHIGDVALEIMLFLSSFQTPHRKDHLVRIRLGIHSGPVAAGVVGITAPRYCLFGDTVNVASRMESTGLPEMIQISDVTNELMQKQYPEFITAERGEVDIKGKGLCRTYWLEGKRAIDIVSPRQLRLAN